MHTLLPGKVVGKEAARGDAEKSEHPQIVDDGEAKDTSQPRADGEDVRSFATAAAEGDETNEKQIAVHPSKDEKIVHERTSSSCPLVEVKVPQDKRERIATLSSSTHRITREKPWKLSPVIQVNGEEKKVFIPVKRHASAFGPTKWQKKKRKKFSSQQQQQQYGHLPDGDNGDGILNPHPKEMVPDKFWAQRKRLFSRYDEGIQIEHGEMWYSVTPESIAKHVAKRMVQMVQQCRRLSDTSARGHDGIVILDAFCGCGGNAIAFALANSVKVIAVDNDLTRLEMAANNARIYGIDEKDILFVHADVVDVLSSYSKGCKRTDNTSRCENESSEERTSPGNHHRASGYKISGLDSLPEMIDAVFLSPPWGGMDYDQKDDFDPVSSITVESKVKGQENESTLVTNGGELFHMSAEAVFSNSNKEGVVAYFLPRNVNGIAVGQIAVTSGIEHECFELEQNVVNGKVKTVTAYFGRSLSSK
ncbi:hypothetical protein HJC23_014097 [Cyclotella cryptica]|uniref:Trimethylguanosine synthase n=1 Tax=Cyclotella cryptica TaxID=29204 RepID=A0ABD3QUK7_9STRA